MKSLLLVALQFVLIGLMLHGTAFTELSIVSYLLIGSSILVGLWAIFTMRKSKLRILPAPAATAILVTDGPYRFVRHPMYTAVLLGCTGLLLHPFSLLRVTLLITLLIVLVIKLTWEEKMLCEKFSAYTLYKEKTNKLIPFIF